MAVLGDKISRRLGDEPDAAEQNQRREGLENRRDAPRPVVLDGECAKGDPRRGNGSDVPQLVIDSCHAASMLRMANLSQEERRRVGTHAVAEADEEAAGDEHGEVLRGALDRHAREEEHTSHHDGDASAKDIGKVWPVEDHGSQ